KGPVSRLDQVSTEKALERGSQFPMRIDELLLVPRFHFETHHVECCHVTPPFVTLTSTSNRLLRSQARLRRYSTRPGRTSLLLPLRQRQDRSLAPDVDAIEETHAEQGDGQAIALRDDCLDVMHGHFANAYRVELETIGE